MRSNREKEKEEEFYYTSGYERDGDENNLDTPDEILFLSRKKLY